jgi:phospholipase/carboxylesterase
MAMRLALRHPDRFAGAASLNGTFPEAHAPLARLPELRPLRLMIAHCRDSERYSINRLCRELSLFHSASLSVHLRQYPCADELTTQMLHDLDAWLMEQVTGTAATESAALAADADSN